MGVGMGMGVRGGNGAGVGWFSGSTKHGENVVSEPGRC